MEWKEWRWGNIGESAGLKKWCTGEANRKPSTVISPIPPPLKEFFGERLYGGINGVKGRVKAVAQ